MRRGLVLAAVVALAGCESSPRLPIVPAYRPAEPQAPAPPPPPATPPPAADACGAAPLQSLIGHPKTEIPVPLRPERQRVMCTTCPMTMDFAPERLNFLFDAKTGLIAAIRCG